MTRSLLLNESGDLAVLGRSTQLVSGTQKLIQDLNCWLKESFGVDRFHRAYGSVLRNFVGGVVKQSSAYEIQAEVMRVLKNYQQVQLIRFREKPGLFSREELLERITSVEAAPFYDRVDVRITIQTAGGNYGTMRIGVTP